MNGDWLVCGSRTIRSKAFVDQCLDEAWATHDHGRLLPVIYTGGAKGVDTLAHFWARTNGLPTEEIRADWDRHGRRAGIVRNLRMLDAVGKDGLVIAIWDGESRGTAHTVEEAKRRNMRLTVYYKIEGDHP